MRYVVQGWEVGPSEVPGLVIHAAELECGHAWEHHAAELDLWPPSEVECGVCALYASWAAELEAPSVPALDALLIALVVGWGRRYGG